MIALTGKSPAEVASYTIPATLADGDSVATAVATVSTGTAVIDSQAASLTGITLQMSGGAVDETTFISITFTTVNGLTDTETAVLPVFDGASELLAEFRLCFPELASLDDGQVSFFISKAGDHANWPEECRNRARITLAAHRLTETAGALSGGGAPKGVTSFKSGTFSATWDSTVANRTGFDSSIYGRQYDEMRRMAFTGVTLAWVPGCL